MTMDMIMGLVRQVLPFLGAIAVTVGWTDAATANSLVNQGLIAAGAVSTMIGTVWSIQANTQASILRSVADNPSVKNVEVTDPELAISAKSHKVKAVAPR